ncbi:MAG: lysozyme inhibitor LprI family protein [Pseudomonadota bacterium]
MIRAAISLVCILLATPTLAQEWDCTDPASMPQQQMNYCAAKDFERADAALNAAWKLIYPDYGKSMEGDDHLLNAQRAWLRYRDAQCDAEGLNVEGGSLEPFIVATCRARMTQDRTTELLLLERFR